MITLNINGQDQRVGVAPDTPLLWVLRDTLQLTGTKFGCGMATFTEGKVDQSNFHNYMPLRISDMPKVEVHIVPSATAPTGIGEPPLAPAVLNSLAAAIGKRIGRLPIGQQLVG